MPRMKSRVKVGRHIGGCGKQLVVSFATSLLAAVAGIVAKVPLEKPTFVGSILCLLVLVLAIAGPRRDPFAKGG